MAEQRAQFFSLALWSREVFVFLEQEENKSKSWFKWLCLSIFWWMQCEFGITCTAECNCFSLFSVQKTAAMGCQQNKLFTKSVFRGEVQSWMFVERCCSQHLLLQTLIDFPWHFSGIEEGSLLEIFQLCKLFCFFLGPNFVVVRGHQYWLTGVYVSSKCSTAWSYACPHQLVNNNICYPCFLKAKQFVCSPM